MRYFADKIVYDKYEPENTNVVWVQPTEEGAQIKAYIDGEWQLIGYDHDAYRKPELGIPESDLEESVRNAIDNAQLLDGKIDAEQARAESAEGGLDERLGIVEQLADISISGGDATIATASDFNNPTTAQKAYIPTVGAILDGADTTPTSGSGKLVTSGGVYNVINSLKSAGYVFVGVATPSTSPGTPTEKVFYIGGAGTYANFGASVTIPVGSIGVFKYNGSWTKEQIALYAGIDDVPTKNSNNLVKSGGVYGAITDTNIEIGAPIDTLTSTFPKSSYYSYYFYPPQNGKYYVKFSGTQINGNVNINKNDNGTVSVVVRDYNPSVSGNECHFEITATNLVNVSVFFPATLAASINGDVTIALYRDENVRYEIEATQEEIAGIQAVLPNPSQIRLENLIVGDFSKTTPFSFRGNLTYTIVGNEIIVTNVGSVGYQIWYQYPAAKKVQGHKYYFSVMMKSNTNNDDIMVGDNGDYVRCLAIPDSEYHILSVVQYQVTAGLMDIRAYNVNANVGSRNTYIKSAVLIDLTACFGAGNEPTKEFVDDIILSQSEGYLDGAIILENSNNLTQDVYNINTAVNDIIIESGKVSPSVPVVVSPSMDYNQFRLALNDAYNGFATLNMCSIESFLKTDTINGESNSGSWDRMFDLVNKNFRKDIYQKGKSFKKICDEINTSLTEQIYRFKDAKVGSMLNWSLETGMQADEPSAIVSDDGSTLYIYAHLKRISTTDGVNWTAPVDTPITGDITYLMHNCVNYIDGVYYLIGCHDSTGGSLYLCTSTDGINFTLRGRLFDAGYEFRSGVPVRSWGNPYLLKEPGGNRYFLYIETISDNEVWVINLAICEDLFHANADGTIGDWDVSQNRTILKSPLKDRGIISGNASSSAGNPDFARGVDNRPIKVDGKYFMYFHSTWKGIAHIMRASSVDLLNWEWEGICLDNRDTPTGGDATSGNADQTVIEFKGRTYMFYTWDINNNQVLPYIKYTVDDRPFIELLRLRP